GRITEFIEKPKEFVSDLAIIGVYYFRDGENLKAELQYLIDNDIRLKGEYQITDAMENMKEKGVAFYTDQVEEWLDCGNKDATLYTLERVLEIKKETENLIMPTARIENATIIPPCFIGDNVVVRNAVVGPYVSLEAGAVVESSVIRRSIIGQHCLVNAANLHMSLLGNHVSVQGKTDELSLGDYSFTR
ncbi:MAG: nucleotidyltransferase, partial [Chitinophagaceae bacterium]|nr:nucleotidyltransferase [Chitinophagaceae bacterium]